MKKFKKFTCALAVAMTVVLLASAWTPVAANTGQSWAGKIATVERMIEGGEFAGLNPAEMTKLLDDLGMLKACAETEAGLLEALEAVREEGAERAISLQNAIDNPKPTAEGEFSCAVKSMIAKVGKQQAIPYEWTGAGAVTFGSSNPAVCTVNQYGSLLPLKTGIVVITISAPNGMKALVAVTVTA